MQDRTAQRIEFGRVGRRVVEAKFDGGDLSSDGGLMLLQRVDERIGLTRAVAAVFSDGRDPAKITHRVSAEPELSHFSGVRRLSSEPAKPPLMSRCSCRSGF